MILTDAEPGENEFGGTEAGEGGLDEVQADKGGEQQPIVADQNTQAQADQHHGSGQDANGIFHFHSKYLCYRD
jgi:hypothetical protein